MEILWPIGGRSRKCSKCGSIDNFDRNTNALMRDGVHRGMHEAITCKNCGHKGALIYRVDMPTEMGDNTPKDPEIMDF